MKSWNAGKLPFIALFAIGWLCTAFYPSCSPRLLVPPTHIANGDAPHTLPPGTASIGLNLEMFGEGGFQLFDNTITEGTGVTLEGTVGLTRDLDLRLMGTAVSMSSTDKEEVYNDGQTTKYNIDWIEQSGLSSGIRSAGMRVKWNPGANRIWSMTGGAGIGSSQGQSFYSLESAQILGFENRFFVPYMNLKIFVSVPISPDTIWWNTTDGQFPINGGEPYGKKPRTTFGTEALMGFKIPLSRTIPNPPFLKLEVGAGTLEDGDQAFSAGLWDFGIEIPFKYRSF